MKGINICLLILVSFMITSTNANAQTDADAIMMAKNNFCIGPMYGHSSWKQYWEGTFKRENLNLGTVSSQNFALMGNYGISNKLNVLFSLPYITTKASAGTLKGQKGLQDLSLWIKWMPVEKKLGKGTLSLYTIGGYALPVSNYVKDYLPLSIGLGSKNISLRGMVDYQLGSWFATISGTFIRRSNITLDRQAYFTTEMHYTNEVKMPDATQAQLRLGYRNHGIIAEAIVTDWKTLGGFDITKNNMPFPSNKMNMTNIGINLKYEIAAVSGLSLIGGGNYVVHGRNVGQSKGFYGGVFYILDFSKKQKEEKKPADTNQQTTK